MTCKIKDVVKRAFKLYPCEKIGGCFQATRWLIKQCPTYKEEVLKIQHKEGSVTHVVARAPDGNIIDTQVWQFGLILPGIDPDEAATKGIYTEAEHKKLLPRYVMR